MIAAARKELTQYHRLQCCVDDTNRKAEEIRQQATGITQNFTGLPGGGNSIPAAQRMVEQLEQLQNMGDLSQIAGMLPGGMGKQLESADLDGKQMAHTKAIIQSMTPLERENPQILNASRKRRIAAGCGLEVVDVNRLLKSFEMLQQITKSMSKGKFRGFPGMGGMPAMGGKMHGFGRKKRFK